MDSAIRRAQDALHAPASDFGGSPLIVASGSASPQIVGTSGQAKATTTITAKQTGGTGNIGARYDDGKSW